MYTKRQFGRELKQRILKNQAVVEIGNWAYVIYLDYSDAGDINFLRLLLTLNAMELGPVMKN
jgi:hypothetical protein